MSSFDRRAFWEAKILSWEEGRYAQSSTEGGLLERIADWSSDSLRFRLQITGELLAPHVQGRHVVDVGCGSGRLAPAILQAGAASYLGLDLADAAIEVAQRRATEEGWGDRATFAVADVHHLPDTPRDVVISLGLTDWLDDPELRTLFDWAGDAHYLHALSEDRRSVTQWLHKTYCYLAYGHRTDGYVPRYFSCEHLAAMSPHHEAWVYRHKRLSFGALVSSLPIGEPLARS